VTAASLCPVRDKRTPGPRQHLGPHADRADGKPTGLAARIVRRRLALEISQEQAAEALGVSRSTFAAWELGRPPRGLYRAVLDRWLRGEA